MLADPSKHVGEPSAGIDAIELTVIMSEYIAAARWPPRADPANSHDLRPRANATQSAFSGVVAEADPTIAQEASEGLPALEHIVDRLGDIGVSGHSAARASHPALQRGNQRCGALLADREAQ